MSPARIDLSDSAPRVLVTVHNDDVRSAMVVNMQPMVWTRTGVASHYELTSDVVARPATIVVAPGATRTVEVDLLSAAGTLHGECFRLFWQAQSEPYAGPAHDDRAAP